MEQPVAAVGGPVDEIAILVEPLGDVIAGGLVVLDDEYLLGHRHSFSKSA